MSNARSPYDMATTMTAYAPNPYRPSRTPTSQSSHSYRIEKPRSNHNSPRTVERRKTTTGAKLYATLDDHYNMMMGIAGDDHVEPMGEPATSRPMSWHPSSNQYNTQPQSNTSLEPAHDWSQNYSARSSTHGSDFYSFSARNSMGADATQHYTDYANGYPTHRGSQDSDASWQTQPSCAHSSYSTPATEAMPWYLQEWARKNQEQAGSQNASMEFLPIQQPTQSLEQSADESMEDSSKELIGMGLYDVSDSSLDWSSPLGEATGKGLKLEETWQPPEDDVDEEDEDDDDQDDNASSDDGEEELPPPPAPPAPVAPSKAQSTGNMDGQSFFFDEDDNVTKEWWYQHLKQPSMPVRDAGYGYGWL